MNPTPQTGASASPPEEAEAVRPEFVGGGRFWRLDPVGSLVYHKRLAIVLFLLISSAGLPVVCFKARPAYHTQASVYIAPRFIENPRNAEESRPQSRAQYREFIEQNLRIIRRLDVAQETLRRLGENGKRWWLRERESDRGAAERLAGALIVSPEPDAYQVIVGLDGDRPEGLAEIVNTLLDVYIDVQESGQSPESESLAKELADLLAQRAKLARELGVGDFTENYVNPYGQLVASSKQALAEASRQRILAAGKPGAAGQQRAEISRSEQDEKALAADAAEHEEQASWFAKKYQEGIGLSQRIEQARQRQESTEQMRRSRVSERKGSGVVRVLAKAQPAALPPKDGRPMLALMFALAGLAIALIAPVAVDIVVPRLIIPHDAGRVLGSDPLGWLPERNEAGEEFMWDLILRLANRIHRERQAHGTRIWMFSSVKSGGGTTALVNSLGKALTILGVPTLTVDANPSPANGHSTKESTGQGLCMLLRGHSTLSESIEHGGEETPDRIPAGALEGTTHLPHIHRFMDILGEAAQTYTLVLVDLAPLLDSLDCEYLARRSDCVVLVAEARQVKASELKRAAETLKREHPNAVYCVLNRVRLTDGGGFAQEAKREFENGAVGSTRGWYQPWLRS